MAKFNPSFVALAAVVSVSAMAQAEQTISFARYPALSPNGQQLVFSYQGDLWTTPVNSKVAARRLTIHPGYDARPFVSPDGKMILFTSNRLGRNDAYVMPIDGGNPIRLTAFSGGSVGIGWAPDSKSILITQVREHVGTGAGIYRVQVTTKPSRPVNLLSIGRTAGATLASDNKTLAFVRGSNDWPRIGYHGTASADIYIHMIGSKDATKVTDFDGQDLWPQFIEGGRELVYVSEKDGTYNLWRVPVVRGGQAKQVTFYQGDGVRFPSVSADGTHITFEVGDQIIVLALNKAGAKPEVQVLTAPLDARVNPQDVRTITGGASEVSPSDDGEQIALVAQGDIFVTTGNGGKAQRVSEAPERDADTTWSPDGKSLVYVTRKDGQPDLYVISSTDKEETKLSKATTRKTERLTDTLATESNPRFSPDGKKLAYISGRQALIVADADGTNPKQVARGLEISEMSWSPDSRWLTYALSDEEYNSDVMVVKADGGSKPINVTKHPRNDGSPAWSPDGTKLFFVSERGKSRDLIAQWVYLRKEDDERTADAWQKLKGPGRQATAGAPAPSATTPTNATVASVAPKPEPKLIEVDADGIHDRVRVLLTPKTTVRQLAAGGTESRTTVAVVTGDDGAELQLIDITDGAAPAPPRKIVAPGVRGVTWTLNGKSLVTLSGTGNVGVLAAGLDLIRPVTYRSKATWDRAAMQIAVFDEAWQALNDGFYDPAFHGADWKALYTKYRPMAAAAADSADFGDVIRLLMGHLNASHIGYSPSLAAGLTTTEAGPTAFLGVVWDETYTGPGMKVARVIMGSPADKAGQKFLSGDIITAINGTEIDRTSDIDTLLEDLVGEKIMLSVRGADGTSSPRSIIAGSYSSVSALLYSELMENRKRHVNALSGGKLAYLHIKGMDEVSQDKFEQGLYADGYGKQALLIDVRDNGGGSTADYLLTMLHQPRHAYTIGRDGLPGYPIDRLPYYAWLKPAALLTNQNSYSNAEIFSHAFSQLGRGPVIGTPTFGAVISTGAATLLDGSSVRMPLRGWYRIADGVNEEHTGAPVDVRVDLTVEDELRGLDPQLAAGVKALLEGPKVKSLPAAKRPRYERVEKKAKP